MDSTYRFNHGVATVPFVLGVLSHYALMHVADCGCPLMPTLGHYGCESFVECVWVNAVALPSFHFSDAGQESPMGQYKTFFRPEQGGLICVFANG